MMRVPTLEEDFSEITMRINGKAVKGRNVYDFFVAEEEFDKLSPQICNDGHLGCLNVEVEAIHLMVSSSGDSFSQEDYKSMERGEFIVGNEKDTRKKLKNNNIPERKITAKSRIFGFKN